ncbi:hypothetical protein NC653_015150 [Populus alba x Populus x berolinensis]|uniref:Uncharacterized protein n=1 Tax=Populus alba x Populus x berolinensis TaxID=444605 RepID=A0AAD6QYY1_9ROSI|nr:hypothetical protein NC653_015150 [Populus alba x Populus x berolinensis]
MGFSRLVFLSISCVSLMHAKEGCKKTTIYNFCYTHDFFAIYLIHIFFLAHC